MSKPIAYKIFRGADMSYKINERIKELRTKANISEKEMAEKLNIKT